MGSLSYTNINIIKEIKKTEYTKKIELFLRENYRGK